jgi:hypothetical protein
MGERVTRRTGWGFGFLLFAVGCSSSSGDLTDFDAAGASGDAEAAGAGGSPVEPEGVAGSGGVVDQEPNAGASSGGADAGAGGAGAGAGGADAGAGGVPSDPCTDADGIYQGSLEVGGDLRGLECLTQVNGDLVIRLGADAPETVLGLQVVTGRLALRNEGSGAGRPTSFELRTLERAGSLSVRGLTEVASLAFPALVSVGGDLEIGSNQALLAVDGDTFPELHTVEGDLLIGPCSVGGQAPSETFTCRDNPALARVELVALETVRDLVVGESSALVTLSAPELGELRDLRVAQCLPLHNEQLDRYGDDYCLPVPSIVEVLLPTVSAAERLELMQLSSLARVDLGALANATSLSVSSEGGDYADELAMDLGSLARIDSLYSQAPTATALPQLKTAGSVDLALRGDVNFPELDSLIFLHLGAHDPLVFDCSVKLPSLGSELPQIALSGEVASVSCPDITSMETLRVLYGPATSVDLRALVTAGEISLQGVNALAEVNLSALETAEQLSFSTAPALSAIELPVLRQVGWLDAMHVGSAALRAPVLASVGTTFMLSAAPNLTDLALPALGTVGGMFVMNEADAMIELALPALTSVETLRIVGNDALTSVDAPLLATAVSLEALDNAAFPQCDLESLATSLSISCDCSGNAPCGP